MTISTGGRQAMFDNKREFKRSATDVLVKYRKVEDVDKSTKHYLEGIAENYGMGGVFLATDKPMQKGSVISLDFLLLDEGKEVTIQAKAIVRWIQRFRNPKGMGVEFYDFSGLDGVDVEHCFEKLFQ
jgi:Tfp pilus assembly protein PilZ